MNAELGEEATAFGRAALQAFANAGGDDLVQAAERDPASRASRIEPVLATLGAWELQPRDSADELEAAAALCRSAGWWGLPYPVAERLARPADLAVDGLLVVGDGRSAAAVQGLDLRWAATDLSGRRHLAVPRGGSGTARDTRFVDELQLTEVPPGPLLDVALAAALPCWTLLGMLDRAMALAQAHVQSREQFGQPLARFQGVQFQLADAEVERAGVLELASYALWSIQARNADALIDALALRVAALEAADAVFRASHQLHGAMGFCDESALSWISRYSQPLRQFPWGAAGTLDHLSRLAGRSGIAGLFRAV
jgi:3-oxo-4-pregnene-20-carboxyl-CoA dehydrogenase alpha subunit